MERGTIYCEIRCSIFNLLQLSIAWEITEHVMFLPLLFLRQWGKSKTYFEVRNPLLYVNFSVCPAIEHHISGTTVHHPIIIFGTHVENDGISRNFFHIEILIFWAARG